MRNSPQLCFKLLIIQCSLFRSPLVSIGHVIVFEHASLRHWPAIRLAHEVLLLSQASQLPWLSELGAHPKVVGPSRSRRESIARDIHRGTDSVRIAELARIGPVALATVCE